MRSLAAIHLALSTCRLIFTVYGLCKNSPVSCSGRGRTPTQLPPGFEAAGNVTSSQSEYFLRDAPLNALDGVAFHYSIYRSLTRFLGMDGNLQAAYDVDTNFITAWNEIFVDNDFVNPSTGAIDPKHMFGTSNFDVFRWPSLQNGTQLSVLATFITTMVMPGIPMVGFLVTVHLVDV